MTCIRILTNSNTKITQAEQTVDGDYEEIDYKVFGAVDYDRAMSWESGDSSGRIAIGTGQNISTIQGADIGKSNIDLPMGWFVLVTKAKFRLVRKSS